MTGWHEGEHAFQIRVAFRVCFLFFLFFFRHIFNKFFSHRWVFHKVYTYTGKEKISIRTSACYGFFSWFFFFFPLVFPAEGKIISPDFDDMFLEQCLPSPLHSPFPHIYFPNTHATGENSGRKTEIFAQLCTNFKIALDKYVKRGNSVSAPLRNRVAVVGRK